MKDTEYVELLNVLFASIFAAEASSQESQIMEAREKVWNNEDFPFVELDQVRDHLGKCDTCKSRNPNKRHPPVLRELPDVIAKALSTVMENRRGAWDQATLQGHGAQEKREDWKKADATPVFKNGKKEDPRN